MAVARTAAAARWGKSVGQAELQKQSVLQDAGWTADRLHSWGAEDISVRLADGAAEKPGKLMFDRRLELVRRATVNPPGSDVPPIGNKDV